MTDVATVVFPSVTLDADAATPSITTGGSVVIEEVTIDSDVVVTDDTDIVHTADDTIAGTPAGGEAEVVGIVIAPDCVPEPLEEDMGKAMETGAGDEGDCTWEKEEGPLGGKAEGRTMPPKGKVDKEATPSIGA